MTAANYGRSFLAFGVPALEHIQKHRFFHVLRHAQNIHGKFRFATHSVHIAEGISCGNLTVKVRIIYNRREYVHSLNQSCIIINLVYGGIIAGIKSDQKVWIIEFR